MADRMVNCAGASEALPSPQWIGADHSPNDQWLRNLSRRHATSANLFCFPHAGGSAAAFRSWAAELPLGLQVWAVQLPGRANRFRQSPVDRMPALIDAVAEAMLPLLDRPFACFGHSMGAVLAFEVAQRLVAMGHPAPAHLVVSARRPPHVHDGIADLHPLPDDEFVAEIVARYGGIPPELLSDREMLALLLPSLRADVTAIETFRPPRRPPLGCPITALGGARDRLTPRAHLEAWRSETTGVFRARVFPGDHFYLDSHRSELLADLSTLLTPILPERQALMAVA